MPASALSISSRHPMQPRCQPSWPRIARPMIASAPYSPRPALFQDHEFTVLVRGRVDVQARAGPQRQGGEDPDVTALV